MDYIQLTSSTKLPDISGLWPFKVVVVVEDDVTADRQAALSQWLVESGCLYMMAWGKACGSWADSVRRANREAFSTAYIPDDHLVIATEHDDESLKDVFWFSKHTAMHPCFRLNNIVLLHLAPVERKQELTDVYTGA